MATTPDDTVTTVTLSTAPALAPLLARGALFSPFKKPRPDAEFARTRLVLPSVRADAGKLTAYEQVCEFPSETGELPLPYLHVLGFPLQMRLLGERSFPLPVLGLVHTSIGITRHAPLPSDGTYELTVHVEKLAPHRRGTEATVVTGVRRGTDLVWESSSTYLARHRTDAAPENKTATAPENRTREPRELPAPLPRLAEWRLPADLGRRYGAASGDRNPIHLSPLTARLFGFPRAIAHGMWTVARCLAAHDVPTAARVHAEFKAPVLLPGSVVYAAEDGRFELRGGEDRTHVVGEVRPLGA